MRIPGKKLKYTEFCLCQSLVLTFNDFMQFAYIFLDWFMILKVEVSCYNEILRNVENIAQYPCCSKELHNLIKPVCCYVEIYNI